MKNDYTKFELIQIIYSLINEEDERTRRFIELNPSHADSRKRDRDNYCSAFSELMARLC